MKITVKITKEILRESMWCGERERRHEQVDWFGKAGLISTNCAIAKAIIEILPLSAVTGPVLVWGKMPTPGQTEDYRIQLPYEAREFIVKFDRRTPEKRLNLKPFSFEIEVSEELINEIGIEEAHKIIEKSETLELA